MFYVCPPCHAGLHQACVDEGACTCLHEAHFSDTAMPPSSPRPNPRAEGGGIGAAGLLLGEVQAGPSAPMPATNDSDGLPAEEAVA